MPLTPMKMSVSPPAGKDGDCQSWWFFWELYLIDGDRQVTLVGWPESSRQRPSTTLCTPATGSSPCLMPGLTWNNSKS
jgi:hypothetical protein